MSQFTENQESKNIKPFIVGINEHSDVNRNETNTKKLEISCSSAKDEVKEEPNNFEELEKPLILGDVTNEHSDVDRTEINTEDREIPCWPTKDEVKEEPNNFKELKKPFTVGDIANEKLTQNSEYSNDVRKDKEKDESPEMKQGKMCFNIDIPTIKPIQHISPEAAKLAENFCEKMEENSMFIPYLASAFDQYQRYGGKIENLVLVSNREQKESSLNFTLELKRCVSYVSDGEDGEEYKQKYLVGITVLQENGKIKEYTAQIADDKIKDPKWLKWATHSLATDPSTKAQREEFHYKVQQCIETENVPHEIIYPNAGWREIPNIGWRYIYGGGVVGEKGNLIHTVPKHYELDIDWNKLGSKEIFLNIIGMMGICKTGLASSELFLFVHTSMIATLFEKAGHKISFLFGISGVTNSRKTSMTLAIAKVFGRTDPSEFKADAQFAIATRGGIETTLSTYKDAPVIIDDFKPGANRQEQREMDRKLDELARFYGDGIAKKRMTDFLSNKEKPYFPIYGGCVLTMEIVTGVLSSITRMFITEIGVNEVDNQKLKFYQDNLNLLPTHLYDFLLWTTDKFDNIVCFISEKFKEFREKHKFQVARYSEMYATFKISALLISEYAMERNFLDQQEQQKFVSCIDKMIVKELFSMGNRLKNYDKGTLVLKIFDEMIHNISITFYPITPETCANGESCYEDKNFYYIQTKKLIQESQNFCTKYNEREQIINEGELIGLLEKLDILDIYERDGKRERARKLPTPKGNTKRYLYIYKDKLSDLLIKLE